MPTPPPGNQNPGDDVDAGVDDDSARVRMGLQALYRFDEGSGAIVHDRSGAGTPIDLTVASPGSVEWMAGGGLEVVAPTIIASEVPATRIGSACQSSNSITFEAWVRPAAINQNGPARILSYSIDNANRNFALAQDNQLADARLRTSETDPNGTPALRSNITAFDGRIVHLAYTRNAEYEARLYLNGQLAGERLVEGDFSNWDLLYTLALANEIGENRPWRGELYLAAVYCRDLSIAEVYQNFSAGY